MRFFEDLSHTKLSVSIPHLIRGPVVYIHTAALIDNWINNLYSKKETKSVISRRKILEIIMNEPGFLAHSSSRRISGKVFRCSVFKLEESSKALLTIIEKERVKNESNRIQ